jgi:hypothetical protein
MMKIVAAVSVVSVSGSRVEGWGKKYCDLLEATGASNKGDEFNAAEAAKWFNEFSSLFAAKLDCSEDPGNPYGYNLHDVPITDCMEAKTKMMQHFIKFDLGEVRCLEVIPDEAGSHLAIWLEFGNSGALTAKFTTRAAVRFDISGGVALNYHSVWDTFQYLHDSTSKTKEWAHKYCDLLEATGASNKGDEFNAAESAKWFNEFSSLFAAKLDCSEDPGNPLGYSLHDVPITDCMEAKGKMMQHFIKFDLGEVSCLEVFADEAGSHLAIWLEFGNSGALTAKFTTRAAVRFDISGGVALNYHLVWDTYHYLHGGAVELAQSQTSGTMLVGIMVLAAITFVAGMKASDLLSKKRGVLLDNAVVA